MIKYLIYYVLIISGFVSQAWANDAINIPDVHIGDLWKYRIIDGYTNETTLEFSHRIVRIDDKEIVIQVQNKQNSGRRLQYFNREWNLLESGEIKWEPYNPENKFPLQVGMTWNQEVKASNNHGGTHSIYTKAIIVALEKVNVPAGIFDAYRIERDIEERSNNSDATVIKSRDVIWYAPAVKKFVRRENIVYSNGRERSKEIIELTEYSLKEK